MTINEKPQPNLFLAGVAIARTTSLYNLLRCHPDIYIRQMKEPRNPSIEEKTR